MGSTQSSHAATNDIHHSPPSGKEKSLPDGVGGRKSAHKGEATPGRLSSVVSVGSAIDAVMEEAHLLAISEEEGDDASLADDDSSVEDESDDDDDEIEYGKLYIFLLIRWTSR